MNLDSDFFFFARASLTEIKVAEGPKFQTPLDARTFTASPAAYQRIGTVKVY